MFGKENERGRESERDMLRVLFKSVLQGVESFVTVSWVWLSTLFRLRLQLKPSNPPTPKPLNP